MALNEYEMTTQPAPAPGGGMTSPGFPSPTPVPGTGGLDPLPPKTTARPMPVPGKPGGGWGSAKPKPLPGGFQRPGQRNPQAELLGNWMKAKQSPVGQDQPVRLSPAVDQNPFIKKLGGQLARPKLGRGFAGGRRFQRGLGNAYGRFMKTGAIQQPAPTRMPTPDFRQRMGQMVRDGGFNRSQAGADQSAVQQRMAQRMAAFRSRRGR